MKSNLCKIGKNKFQEIYCQASNLKNSPNVTQNRDLLPQKIVKGKVFIKQTLISTYRKESHR